jgi:ergosteryl-3beta-O-L-aspartate synthase
MDSDFRSKNQARKEAKRKEHDEKRVMNERTARLIEQRRQLSSYHAEQTESPEQRARYGELPANRYTEWRDNDKWVDISSIASLAEGDEVTFRARIHTSRNMSANFMFVVLRQQTRTIQGVVLAEPEFISPHMVRWIERLPLESIVLVKGIVQKPVEPVHATTVSCSEVRIPFNNLPHDQL